MALDKKNYYGKDVASAIKEACEDLDVAQENLNIEVVETGSTGIFGLIRKKAHIRVTVQPEEEQVVLQKPSKRGKSAPKPKRAKKKPADKEQPAQLPEKEGSKPEPDIDDDDELLANGTESDREVVALTEEDLATIKLELEQILELMGYASEVTVENDGGTALCKVDGTYEEELTGQEGRTIDSLQYLLRKIVSKKVSHRIRLSIDVGNYRERRHQELHDKAIDYAALVKQNGKTQVIPSLNPSERRVVHVALQDDTDIRSRSVGDGLFKKVLIYKPGKGRRGNGRKRSRGNSRKKGDNAGKRDDKS